MIKDNDNKKNRVNFDAPKNIIIGYGKTIGVSFLVALVFTIFLTIHARHEMIKNLYVSETEKQRIDEQLAKQIVEESDLTSKLLTKNYAICMQVGQLYETAKDYKSAQVAYEIAVERAKNGMYMPYYKLAHILIAQEKFEEAEAIINSVTDIKNKNLIKFKTKVYIDEGDKYYSLGKFLKAARSYEKAKYYYDRFTKKDKVIDNSIKKRIVNSYSQAATIVVQEGYNSDAVNFLHKAEKYAPDDFHIKYKLAIIYSDLDPIKSVEYFEPLLKKMPQYIDYSTYNKALLKASNIAELQGQNTKVVYKNDVNVNVEYFNIKKVLFRYNLLAGYKFINVSNLDINKMYAEFVLKQGDNIKETVVVQCVKKSNPLYSNGGETDTIDIKLGKNIFTKKELSQYKIEIYLYKDEKFKTLVETFVIPQKSIKNMKTDVPLNIIE